MTLLGNFKWFKFLEKTAEQKEKERSGHAVTKPGHEQQAGKANGMG
jgi:hypothetical protein